MKINSQKMKSIKMSKVALKRKPGRILCSYDRFEYTSLIGIFISLLIIVAIFLIWPSSKQKDQIILTKKYPAYCFLE
ncbi:hypothetical protein LEP1GSC170_1918 [Leptospira interrogans serovar Bataviae str. HAI135]|nr:hypothetical protein LEP1GSC170_1918 [Leptospira interrogans serovar Bataviae str. HAI135]